MQTTHEQVFWACRRGMLELDLLLAPYAEAYYAQLDEAEQALFRELLNHNDQDLYLWFIGEVTPPDARLAVLVEQIRVYAQSRPRDV